MLEILFVVNSPTKEDAVHKEFASDYDRRWSESSHPRHSGG